MPHHSRMGTTSQSLIEFLFLYMRMCWFDWVMYIYMYKQQKIRNSTKITWYFYAQKKTACVSKFIIGFTLSLFFLINYIIHRIPTKFTGIFKAMIIYSKYWGSRLSATRNMLVLQITNLLQWVHFSTKQTHGN